jgi:hypothetical protein
MAGQPLNASPSMLIGAPTAPTERTAENYVLAAIVVLLVAVVFAALGEGCRHWFILPAILCGILMGADLIAWLRGQIDPFDPKALAAALVFHTTFVAPLLHMGTASHEPEWTLQVQDWGPWYGYVCGLTALGILLYKFSMQRMMKSIRPVTRYWSVDTSRFTNGLAWAIGVSGIASAYVFFALGGLAKGKDVEGEAAFQLSWILMLADPLPLLVSMGIVRILSDWNRRRPMVVVATFLLLLLIGQFVLLGFRGSRSAIIYVVYQVAVMVHYRVRRFTMPVLITGIVLIFLVGYYYRFFKAHGYGGLRALESAEQRKSLQERGHISILGTLLGDLSRAEVQAWLFYRWAEHGERYQLRHGQTYVASALMIIPRGIWYNKPRGKAVAGTDLQYGEGTWASGAEVSSRVYGLTGEAILNFGFTGVPFAWLVYGVIMGYYRKKLLTFLPLDGRYFIVPMLSLAIPEMTFGDSDNVVFFLLKSGVLPIAVVAYSCVRVPIPGRQARAA